MDGNTVRFVIDSNERMTEVFFGGGVVWQMKPDKVLLKFFLDVWFVTDS